MKPAIFLCTFFFIIVLSCNKEQHIIDHENDFRKTILASLKDSLSMGYPDPDKIYLSIINDSLKMVRIAFEDKDVENDFILLQLNLDNSIARGRIIHLNDDKHFISMATLRGQLLVESPIENGYINAFHPDPMNLRSGNTIPTQSGIIELPEVVVVGYIRPGGISYSDWYYLLGLFGDGNTVSSASYNEASPLPVTSYGSGAGSSDGAGNTAVVNDIPIKIDFENQYNDPEIDPAKYLKCFSAIPNAGASCWIELFTDIPVNGDPSKFFDWHNGSPGHTFIQLHKQNGVQSVTQNLGFYPRSGWKVTLSNAAVAGKYEDNGGHEFNASYKVMISPTQLQNSITRILYLDRFIQYDIDDYNCTDWALDVFNETVGVNEHLDIPRYNIPGGMAPNGTSTPNGVYETLLRLKQAGGAAAQTISIPLIGWTGSSSGPCN